MHILVKPETKNLKNIIINITLTYAKVLLKSLMI